MDRERDVIREEIGEQRKIVLKKVHQYLVELWPLRRTIQAEDLIGRGPKRGLDL